MKIIGIILLLAVGIFAYACCMAAHAPDEAAEKFYQEYLEYKRRKEEEG